MSFWVGFIFKMFFKSKTVIISIIVCFIFLGVAGGVYSVFFARPLVSVILPTGNQEKFLPNVIDAVLKQTMKDFELIVIDNATTDQTAEILKSYQKSDSRVKVIRLPKNSGLSFMRETGNRAARGKYIAVMNAKDIMFPKFLEESVHFLEQNKTVTLVKAQAFLYNKGTDPFTQSVPSENTLHQIVELSKIDNAGFVYRREFIKKHKIAYKISQSCAEDYDFLVKMIKKGVHLAILKSDEPLYAVSRDEVLSHKDCTGDLLTRRMGLLYHFNIPLEKQSDNCFVFKKVIEVSPNLFDADTIEAGMRAYCPPIGFSIRVVHDEWSDYFVFSKNLTRFERYASAKEKGTVVSFEPQRSIAVKWDNSVHEVYQFSSDRTYKYIPVINVEHATWEDSFVFSEENKRITRLDVPEEAADVVSFIPQKEIVIKWDNYDVETFIYLPERNVYQQTVYIPLKHTMWSGMLGITPDMQSVFRKERPDEKGTVTYYEPNEEITIKWTNWGEETFLYDKEAQIYQYVEVQKKPISDIHVTHTEWSDTLIFSRNMKQVTRKELPDEKGTVISFNPRKKITIHWDNWGEETFQYDEGSAIYKYQKEAPISDIQVKHAEWSDTLIFSENMKQVTRKERRDEKGTVVSSTRVRK